MISFSRRIAALLYDTISVVMLIYFACFPIVIIFNTLLPSYIFLKNVSVLATTIITNVAYFLYCWNHGQTFGMSSWKLKIVTVDQNKPHLKQLVKRLLFALISMSLFGAGYFAALISSDRKTWHDKFSKTSLVKAF